jgi:sporulation protein YlmC with PRC-barrel domain
MPAKMGVRYIFNTSGNYVAYIYKDNLFNPEGKWLGVIRNGNEVYNINGLHIGYVLEDDRIVRDQRIKKPKSIMKPSPPMKPLKPIKPLKRLRMSKLPEPYEDVFIGINTPVNKLSPRYELKRYNNLLGGSIIAADGTYLGKIIDNSFDEESITNSFGKYGSKFSNTSIFNEFGPYGGKYSKLSPFNPYSSDPPIIKKNDRVLGYLTANEYQKSRIDVHEFVAWLNTL